MVIRGFLACLAFIISLSAFAGPRGKIGDGGGELILDDNITAEEVLKIVKESKPVLRLFIKAEQQAFSNRNLKFEHNDALQVYRQPVYEKLYGGKKTMWDVIENVKVEAAVNLKCYDEKNVEVTGSYSIANNSICINVSRIASRLKPEKANLYILAMMLHEYAHHILLSDEDAVVVYHKNSISRLAPGGLHGQDLEIERYIDSSEKDARTIVQAIDKLIEFSVKVSLSTDLNLNGEAKMRDQFRELLKHTKVFDEWLNGSLNGVSHRGIERFAFLNSDQADTALLRSLRLSNALWFAMKNYGIKTRTCDEYDSVFNQKNSISVGDLMSVLMTRGCRDVYSFSQTYYRWYDERKESPFYINRTIKEKNQDGFETIQILKIKDSRQLVEELIYLRNEYNNIADYISKFKTDFSIPN